MENELILHKILRELCAELGIKMEDIPGTDVYKLTKGEKSHFIQGNYFWHNNLPAGHIADRKHLTSAVLSYFNIPQIEHYLLLNPAGADDTASAEVNNNTLVENFLATNDRIVIKSSNDSRGVGVYLCQNKTDVNQALEQIFSYTKMASICPYYHFESEYRCFFLNGEVLLVYEKTKPHVVGDGKSTVGELVKLLDLPDTPTVTHELQALNLEYIPKEGEKYEISWKHNLSGGATATVIETSDPLYPKIVDLAIEAGEAIDINFATIDIANTSEKGLAVIEINYGVCMEHFIRTMPNGYETAKEIFRRGLLEL